MLIASLLFAVTGHKQRLLLITHFFATSFLFRCRILYRKIIGPSSRYIECTAVTRGWSKSTRIDKTGSHARDVGCQTSNYLEIKSRLTGRQVRINSCH